MSIPLDFLICPACSAPQLEYKADIQLYCKDCDARFEVRKDIPILLTDPRLSTQLDVDSYDEHHRIDEKRYEKVASMWGELFTEYNLGSGDVLEIGAGSGQLTWGLAHKFNFSRVHTCDISHKFLLKNRDNVDGGSSDNVSYYVCDANHLPFQDNKFDVVVGNSVLHHFIDYDKIIHSIRHMLKPGGKAIFFEPVLQGKMWVAFFCDLMLRMDYSFGENLFNNKERSIIEHEVKHLTKSAWIGDDKDKIEQLEDKYIFDISKMEKLSKQAGYSSFSYSNNGAAEADYKNPFVQTLLMQGIPAEKIQRYAIMMVSFKETFGSALYEDIKTPMGYFVFEK